MHHAQISEALQQLTLTEFTKTNSVITVLVCSIAFGMGIEIPDIRRVVHWAQRPLCSPSGRNLEGDAAMGNPPLHHGMHEGRRTQTEKLSARSGATTCPCDSQSCKLSPCRKQTRAA